MGGTSLDMLRVIPELILAATGILIMFFDPFLTGKPAQSSDAMSGGRRFADVLAVIGALAALASVYFPLTHQGSAFSGLLSADPLSIFIHFVVCGVALLVALAAPPYLDRERLGHGEFLALVLFATAGMGVMASAQELVTSFVALETSSIASYVLASYRRENQRSVEAAMKYFLLGSFAAAFFLYGIALVYGASGTTFLTQIDAAVARPTLLAIGFSLIFAGLGFKVAAAPFQLWTPDVYEGAPAPVTAMLSSGPKAAAFALLLRILISVNHASALWFWVLWISAVLTMFVGNLGAVVQSSVKRMLAYSSIAHAGYILVAFAARNEIGTAAVLFYLASYALMKVGAFTTIAWLAGTGEEYVTIDDYAGLASARPVAAACLSLFLLSLLGLPITAGFLGKFYIFDAALKSHLVWLAIIMAINSVIGSYYYLRVIVAMYMRPAKREFSRERVPGGVAAVLAISAAGIIYLGLFPNRVMDLAARAATMFR
jgi:NADH-quinone oxidoreductase subunit N